MENFLRTLPKPLLALLIIIAFIFVVMLFNPPHTICDTQMENLKERQMGVLFANKKNKKALVPVLGRAKSICQQGNGPGACFEYFNLLKKLGSDILAAERECWSELYNLKEAKAAIQDGLEVMVRIAWGNEPPGNIEEIRGWMQDSEVLTFCRLQKVSRMALDEEAYLALRRKILEKLPGKMPKAGGRDYQLRSLNPNVPPPQAIHQLGEAGTLSLSLFSTPCTSY